MQLMSRRLVLAAAGTLASMGRGRNSRAEELESLSRLVPTDPPRPLPEVTFTAADGQTHQLAEFVGRGMVVNLWATWCVPCVAEMPALAALAKTLAPDDIAVLPLSSDRGGTAVVQRFLAAHDIAALPVLLDPDGAAARAFGVRGIPTTIIIDKQGRERARLEGAADWSTTEAAAAVRGLVTGCPAAAAQGGRLPTRERFWIHLSIWTILCGIIPSICSCNPLGKGRANGRLGMGLSTRRGDVPCVSSRRY